MWLETVRARAPVAEIGRDDKEILRVVEVASQKLPWRDAEIGGGAGVRKSGVRSGSVPSRRGTGEGQTMDASVRKSGAESQRGSSMPRAP